MCCVGQNSGETAAGSTENVFIGELAGANNTADNNTFIGGLAGDGNSTGTPNTFIGFQAGESNQTGANNVFVGGSAGSTSTTENQNTVVGSGADITAGNTNATAVGYNSKTTANNQVMLGNISVTEVSTGGHYKTSQVLGGATTPTTGGYYQDNGVLAWGNFTGSGGGLAINAQFGNMSSPSRTSAGVYTVQLPTSPSAPSVVVSGKSAGVIANAFFSAGNTITIFTGTIVAGTYTASDAAFFLQVIGRP